MHDCDNCGCEFDTEPVQWDEEVLWLRGAARVCCSKECLEQHDERRQAS